MRSLSPRPVRRADDARGFLPTWLSNGEADMPLPAVPMFLVSSQCKAVPLTGQVAINDVLPSLARSNSPIERLLGIREPETVARLHFAIEAAAQHRVGSVLIARTGDGSSARFLRIRPMREAACVLLIVEPMEGYPLVISPEYLKSTFGLATSEAEIALSLAGGMDAAAIAMRRGVKKGTVRDQIKALLRKMGLSSQKQLLVVLTRLSDSVRA